MKFPNKMPVFSGRPLSHRSPADRLKQERIPVRFSRFSEAQAGKQRDRQTGRRLQLRTDERPLYINTMRQRFSLATV
jgi:hypothetical protein